MDPRRRQQPHGPRGPHRPRGPRGGHQPPQAIGFLLGHAARRARGSLEEELEPFGLRLQHFMLVMALSRAGARSQQQLGDWLGVDRTTMVALVDQLERHGYATREKDPADRRAYLVELTDEGRALLPKLRSRASAAEKRTLAPLDAQERELFRELLVKLVIGSRGNWHGGPPPR
jgi:DNA-binding MarR family transcriptional regulator